MLNPTSYKYKYDIKGMYNLSIAIDILEFIIDHPSRLFIKTIKANLRQFKYVDINHCVFIQGR